MTFIEAIEMVINLLSGVRLSVRDSDNYDRVVRALAVLDAIKREADQQAKNPPSEEPAE